MPDTDTNLRRIAEALERLSPQAGEGANWMLHPAYVWEGHRVREISELETSEAVEQELSALKAKRRDASGEPT